MSLLFLIIRWCRFLCFFYQRYGLKLRGTSSDAGAACSPSSAPALTEYQLELKWRKTVSSAPAGLAENWKKVVKHTTICAAVPFVARECLPPLRKARDGANLLRKHKVTEGISALIQQLEQRTTASSAAEESGSGASASAASPSAASNERQHAFYVVAVRKQRHVVSQLDGEQTDIEVELLWRGGAHMDAASAAVRSEQRRVFRFRSICFEGSEGATTAKHVQRLFEHLRQRYGDMRNHCGQAQVRADASRAAAAASAVAAPGAASGAMAAFVGGYPEFLMHVLQLVPPASSNAAAAAAASKQ
jgi:hypothetical protein